MVFIVYLQRRLKTLMPLRLVTQAVLAVLALACAISRLVDHRHHPEDVVAGSLIGILIGSIAAQTLGSENMNPKID